ncbi:hypothetical protein GCK72_011716 [Caenorhabditis remanei]|uniref:RING-type domain-containing protein n=1 Tax=Caenorhabditis remanei TaxID=31234 RepID=A0A6A5H6I9_CAERE|nr:hypothetical protein GCK72_011716 [Caenorhabditis remanei]KAF1763450.1 hypothetical protein GCK72_011716 [Caenorhabditis remanei]
MIFFRLFPEESNKFSETKFQDLSNLTSGFIWEENQDKWILTTGDKQYESNYSHMPAKLKKKSKVKYFVMERAGDLEASNMTNIEKYKKAYNIENLAIRCFKATNMNDPNVYILLEDMIDVIESLSDGTENNILRIFKPMLKVQGEHFYEANQSIQLSMFFEQLVLDKTQVTIIPDAYQNLSMQKTRKEFFTPITTVNSYGTVVMDTSQAMLYTLLKIVIGIDWIKAEQKIGTDSMNEFKKKFFALMETYENRARITFVSKHHVDQQIEIIRQDLVFKQLVRKIPECFKDGQNMNNEITLATNNANLARYSLPIYAARIKIFKLSMQWYSYIFSWINSFYLHEKLSQKVILMQAMYCKLSLCGASPIDEQLEKDVEYWTEQTTVFYREAMAGVANGKPNVLVQNYETELKKRRKEASKTLHLLNGNTSVLGNVQLTSIVQNAQQKALEVLKVKPFLETSEAPPPGSGLSSDTSYSTSKLDTSAEKFEPSEKLVSPTVAAKTPKAPPLPEKKQNEAAPIERTKKPASLTVALKTPEAPPLSSNEVVPIERPNDAKYWREKCFTAGEHCSNALKAQKSAERKAKEYETKAKRTEEVEKEMKKMKKEMEKLKEKNEKMEKELEEANETIQKKKEKELKLREELKSEKKSSEVEKQTFEATNKFLEDQIQDLKDAMALSEQTRKEAERKLQELQISQPSTSKQPSYKSKLEELINLKDEFAKRLLKTQAKKMSDVLTAESDDPAIKEMVEKETGIFRKSYDEYLHILLRNIWNLKKFLGTRPLIPLPAEPAIPEKLWDAYRAHTDPHKPLIGKNECHFCYDRIEPSERTAHCGHEKCEAVLHFECACNWYTTGTKSVECMYCKEPFLDIKAVKRGPWRC